MQRVMLAGLCLLLALANAHPNSNSISDPSENARTQIKPKAKVEAVLPYDTFNAAFQLVQYCVVQRSGVWGVDDSSSEAQCRASGGSWETRPGLEHEPAEAYGRLVAAREAEVRASGAGGVWLLRVAEHAQYYASRMDEWERLTGASIADNLRVHERRLYVQLHATAGKVDALVGTGHFDVAMALPVELLVHPDVIVAAQHAGEGAGEGAGNVPARSLRIVHAVTLEAKQEEARALEELSRAEGEEERDRLLGRWLGRGGQRQKPCPHFEGCRMERSGQFGVVKSVPHGSLVDVARDIVAADSSVLSVMISPTPRAQNYDARPLIQSGTVGDDALTPLYDAGLHGENIVVSVTDDGLDHMSCYFYDPDNQVTFGSSMTYSSTKHRKIRQYIGFLDTEQGVDNGHGTHVCGSAAGESTGSDGSYNGMAYKSKIAFYDIKLSGDTVQNYQTYLPASITNDILAPAYAAGARVFSNSWNLDVVQYHSAVCIELDLFAVQNQDILLVFPVGNGGDEPGAAIYAPATAKNVVAVGATENGVENPDVAPYSSRGPSPSGAIRPTVTAPGYSTTSAASEADPSGEHCSTSSLQGTSMATPLVAGTAALLQQYFQEGFYPTGKKNVDDGFKPMGSLLHAMLVNSGQKMTGAEANRDGKPWQNYGFGMTRADASVFLLGHSDFDLFVDGRFSDKCSTACPKMVSGRTTKYQFKIRGNTHPLKVTLVWRDVQGAALVNDLDLKVYEGQSTTPLAVNNLSPGQRDSLNNVEQVWEMTPTVGATYRVEVVAQNVPTEAFYALAVTGNFYKDETYYANYVPVVTSSAYANGQVLLFGERFGLDETLIEATLTCDDEPMDSLALAASDDTVVFNVSQGCTTIKGSLLAQTFYLNSVGSVVWSDASIAKSCKHLDPTVCAATMDCEVSGSKCKVSEAASDRTGYTGKEDDKKQYGVYEIAIAAIVVFLAIVLLIGGYKVCCKKDPNARNSEDSEDDQPPPVAAVAAVSSASSRNSLPPGWKIVTDANTGRQYYWNVRTNETSWVRPAAVL